MNKKFHVEKFSQNFQNAIPSCNTSGITDFRCTVIIGHKLLVKTAVYRTFCSNNKKDMELLLFLSFFFFIIFSSFSTVYLTIFHQWNRLRSTENKGWLQMTNWKNNEVNGHCLSEGSIISHLLLRTTHSPLLFSFP
jgi:hypothetical protein